ncbi:hypothetical protein ANO11243_060600 [Dothideomycetidae sp. 11243]|nr:hypothetical protein ANO11243_060600 [fungal sp. No.11243]
MRTRVVERVLLSPGYYHGASNEQSCEAILSCRRVKKRAGQDAGSADSRCGGTRSLQVAMMDGTLESSKRRSRPCDACRRRKIRCLYASDDSDQCVLCQSRSVDCTFVDSPPRKRRHLSISPEVSRDGGAPKLMQSGLSTNPATSIQDYSALTGPTLLRRTLGHQNRQSCSYLGPTSEHDPFMLDLYPFDKNEEYRVNGLAGVFRRVDHHTHCLLRVGTAEEIEQELSDLDQIESIVAPYGPALVKLYFRTVHPSFPIVHKKVFLEKYGRTYRELTPLGLSAVYLLALDWWTYSHTLASLPKPSVGDLEALVSRIMASIHIHPKISDVQACLLIAQRPDADSWARTGLLVSLAQTMGVHLDCSNWSIPQWEKGVRKRIAWSLFMQDKWGAVVYGRPSHITKDNWEVNSLDDSDFPETSQDDDNEEGSSETEVGKLIFLAMISLTEILADILDGLYSLKTLRANLSTSEVLERAKPLQIRLKQWYSELPPSLSIGETKSGRLSPNGYLHLSYLAAEVTLHRAIVRSHNTVGTDPELCGITREAAKVRFTSAVDFVKRLQPEHLQSFWYFTSKLNLSIIATFGITLLMTSPNDDEAEFYSSQLSEYRWKLRVSSMAAEFMKYTVTLLDMTGFLQKNLQSKARRFSLNAAPVHEKMMIRPLDSDPSPGSTASPYDVQLNWLQDLEQPFDINIDDLAGYSMDDDFSAYQQNQV